MNSPLIAGWAGEHGPGCLSRPRQPGAAWVCEFRARPVQPAINGKPAGPSDAHRQPGITSKTGSRNLLHINSVSLKKPASSKPGLTQEPCSEKPVSNTNPAANKPGISHETSCTRTCRLKTQKQANSQTCTLRNKPYQHLERGIKGKNVTVKV